ncbi:MAG: hypothetical protein AAB478_04620 [Patescibacteria group bacterium]
MKKFIVFFALVGVTAFLFAFHTSNGYLLSGSYCDTPISYHLGSLDDRFNLTREEAIADLKEAAGIWNQTQEKTIFEFEPTRKGVTINLVYDARTALSNQINSLEQKVDTDKNSLNPKVQEYKTRSAAFDQKAAALNAEIRKWNSQGGAPPDVYQGLKQQQSELQAEASALNAMAAELNQSTRDYNSQVRSLNSTIDALNQSLSIKPEEGLYDGATNTISIYFNNSHDELIHTMTHELGHARGMDHINDLKAIMYSQSTENIIPTVADLDQLNEICKERSLAEIYWTEYINFARSLKARILQQ